MRLGNAHPALNSRQTTVAILVLFTFLITTWHWFGAPSHVATTQLPAFRKQPKNWSVSGKGNLEGVADFKKPANLSVVAMVFYGRPATVSILDCYLKVRGSLHLPRSTILTYCCREILRKMEEFLTKLSGSRERTRPKICYGWTRWSRPRPPIDEKTSHTMAEITGHHTTWSKTGQCT